MRIAMIGQKGIPARWGGIERHVEELAKKLADNGQEVLVYGRKWYVANAPATSVKGVTSVVTPTVHSKHLDAIIHTFTSTIHALLVKADVIHYHGVGPALLAWIPRIFSPRTKVIVTFHCIDRFHQKWNFLARTFLRMGEWAACHFPHQTITVSKTLTAYCRDTYGVSTAYIPNGVEEKESVSPAPLATLGLEPKKFVVMISRLVPHKGAQYLITAWQTAQKNNPALFADLKLAIVGDGSFSGSYFDDLQKMASGDSTIVFTGWQSGVARDALYQYAKLLVHPSESEGLPLTVLEALGAGTPVLVSDIPEHRELITSPNSLFANKDSAGLATQMTNILSHAEKTVTEAGMLQKRILAEYQWSAVANATIALYEKNSSRTNSSAALVQA